MIAMLDDEASFASQAADAGMVGAPGIESWTSPV
jgi:hypothetical protein